MKTPTHHFIRMRLEIAVIAFFILAALSLLVVYVADPEIYAQTKRWRLPNGWESGLISNKRSPRLAIPENRWLLDHISKSQSAY